MHLKPEARHTRQVRVETHMTARSVSDVAGEHYPSVLGTPFLVAELERTAAALLQDDLAPGEASVGVDVQIRHLAPTSVGDTLSCQARYSGREDKLFWFDITASDSGGLVAKGRHSRAIVPLADIETKAAARRAP